MAPKPQRPKPKILIPPDQMGTTAMSDEMTVGIEQIVVSITLMIVSLCFLSRHRLKRYSFYAHLFGSSKTSSAHTTVGNQKNNVTRTRNMVNRFKNLKLLRLLQWRTTRTKLLNNDNNNNTHDRDSNQKYKQDNTNSTSYISFRNYSWRHFIASLKNVLFSEQSMKNSSRNILRKSSNGNDEYEINKHSKSSTTRSNSTNNNSILHPKSSRNITNSNKNTQQHRKRFHTSHVLPSLSSPSPKKSLSPMRKCQSSPMVSSIPLSIVTTPLISSSNSTINVSNDDHDDDHDDDDDGNSSNPHTPIMSNNTPQSTTFQTPQQQHQQQQHQQNQNHFNNTTYNETNEHENDDNNNNYTTTTTSYNTNNNEYDDFNTTSLTDHERFTKVYESHLRYAEYRRLILPPTCRKLDIDATKNTNTNSSTSTKNKSSNNEKLKHGKKKKRHRHYNENPLIEEDEEEDNDEDDHENQTIFSWFIDVTHKIISFDYIGNTFILILRICKAFMCRFRRVLVAWGYNVKILEDEDEEEDDDLTVGSMSSKKSLLSKESMHSHNGGGGSGSVGNVSSSSGPVSPLKPIAYHNHSSYELDYKNSTCVGGTRERFYTGEGPGSISHTKKNNSKAMTCKDESGQQQQTAVVLNISSEFPRVESVSSLLAYSESWEDEQKQHQQHQGQAKPLDPMNDSLVGAPAKQLSETASEEKKDTSTICSIDDHSHLELFGSMSSELLNVPSFPDMNIEMSPSNSDHGTIKNVKTRNGIVKTPLITPKHFTGKFARQGSKQKDALTKHMIRNTATISPFIPTTQMSQTHDEKKTIKLPPSPKRVQSTELSYYFDTVTNKATIKKLERDLPLPDKEGYILGDQYLEDSKDTPLLVFVNSRSGSQQGLMLKMQLRSLMNPIQIWDLADGGPENVLKSFLVFSRLRLLVCGGDGTVSWIIAALNKMNIEKWPPIAILPLGTGNDLARIHGWGGGYANESLLLILRQVQEAYISLLDRWTIKIERKKKKKKGEKKEVHEIKPFTNYMSIGMDALSALQVHNLRENSPDMFFSRAINKLWYTLYGAEDAIKASCSDLPQQVVLFADGVEVPIPKDSRGLIILNIDSYLGGVPLWSRGVPVYHREKTFQRRRERRYSDGDSIMHLDSFTSRRRAGSFDSMLGEDADSDETKLESLLACDSPSSCQDGLLDVISITGNFHLGQIRVGIANAHRICQCKSLKIELKKSVAVQLDGEPWKQDKSVLAIEREQDPAIMLHRATEGGGGIETEVADLLEWAEDNNIIERDVHATLMKEFSRRIETKTRARRDRNEANVFSTMKRGIASRNRLNQPIF